MFLWLYYKIKLCKYDILFLVGIYAVLIITSTSDSTPTSKSTSKSKNLTLNLLKGKLG